MATIHRYQCTIMNFCASSLKNNSEDRSKKREIKNWKEMKKKQIVEMCFPVCTHTNIKMAMTKTVNISCNVRRQKTLRTKLLLTMMSLKSPIYSSASSCGRAFLLRCSRTQALYSSKFSLSLCATISSVTVTVYGP